MKISVFSIFIFLAISTVFAIENQNQTHAIDDESEELTRLKSVLTNEEFQENLNQLNEDDHEEKDFEELEAELIKEFGLNKGTITKQVYKEFILKLFTRNETLFENDEEFYREVVDKISEQVPESFEFSELSKYVDFSKYMSEIEKLIGTKEHDSSETKTTTNEELKTNKNEEIKTEEIKTEF